MLKKDMPRIYTNGLDTFKKYTSINKTMHHMFVSEFEYLLTKKKLNVVAIEISDIFKDNYDLSSAYSECLFESSKYFIFEGDNGSFDNGYFADSLKDETVQDVFILVPDYNDIKKESINEILTLKEAASIWNKDTSTLRRMINSSKFKEGIDYRKSGSTWLVTKESMFKVYGEPNLK